MAALLKDAVQTGDYASTSEVVREAVRDWRSKRALALNELAKLKAEIDQGLADIDAGRLVDLDPDRIISEGRRRLADSSASG